MKKSLTLLSAMSLVVVVSVFSMAASGVNFFQAIDSEYISVQNRLGVGTMSPSPSYVADIVGPVRVTGALNVSGGLTGSASLNVLKTGDTMSGPLTLNGSSLTVTGASGVFGLTVSSNASIGGVLTTRNGRLGINQTNPLSILQLGGTSGLSFDTAYAGYEEIPSGMLMSLPTAGNIGLLAKEVAGNKIALVYSSGANYWSAAEIANPSSGKGNLLLMKSGGNVGIGTTGPQHALEVIGNITNSGTILSSGAIVSQGDVLSYAGSNTRLRMGETSVGGQGLTATSDDGNTYQNMGFNATSYRWDLGSNTKMAMATDGNITVVSTFTVQGNAFSVGGSTLVVTGGNVGIGDAAPSELLEVAGGIASYSRTMAQLLVITPSQVGVQYFCNNCSPAKMVVSTGTAAGNFADIMGGTFQ